MAEFKTLEAKIGSIREEWHKCHTIHKAQKDYGIDLKKPDSNNGKVSVTVDWKKLGQYQEKWDDWFSHEGHEKETREVAKHLNKAAKKMVNDIAAGQVDTTKHAAKFIGAFTRWVEPGTQCDSDALVKCLQGEGVGHDSAMDIHHDVRHTLKSRCARDTGCHL
jgi:hypothetical protein